MLDMSLMRGVWVDPQQRLARAQAGLPARRRRPRDAGARPGRRPRLRLDHRHRRAHARRRLRLPDAALRLDQRQRRGRWTSSPPTAGWCARAQTENADLFWGAARRRRQLRRRHRLRLRAHPVGPEIVGGAIAWPARRRRAVLELYRTLAERGAAGAHAASPRCASRRRRRGCRRRCTASRSSRCSPATPGRSRRARRLVAPIKSFGKPVGDVAPAPALRLAADAARRDAAEGPALLLEVASTCRGSSRTLCARRDRARAADPLAALGRDPVPARRRAQRRLPTTTPPSATATRASCSTSPASWEQADDDAEPTSSGRARRGATCAASRPAAPTSTS